MAGPGVCPNANVWLRVLTPFLAYSSCLARDTRARGYFWVAKRPQKMVVDRDPHFCLARATRAGSARVHNYYRPNSPLKTRTHVFALGRGPSAGPAAPPRDPSFILRRGLRPRTPGRGLCPRTPTRGLRPLDPHALRAARSACSVSGSRTPPGALPPDPRYWGAPLTGSPRSIK